MKHRYMFFFLINAALVMAIAAPSCSKQEDDIAAPSITILQPAENDTIKLNGGFVTIKVFAQDHVNIKDMEMTVTNQTGAILFSYDADDLENQSYTCNEEFYPQGITKLTPMKLTVTFENEYENWQSKSINFFVKP
jgi:hypothetical protein